MLNQSVDGSKLIMKKCGACSCDSYDAKFNETSKGILRCTVRKLTKRLRDKHTKRDREPSMVPVKIRIRKMRKRLNRQKLKKTNSCFIQDASFITELFTVLLELCSPKRLFFHSIFEVSISLYSCMQ